MTTTSIARVPRDLVVVSGADATKFLQSLVSQDLDPVAVGAVVHTLLLQPQGKLIVEFHAALVAPEEWWCVCEGGFGAQLAAALNRFKIRVKVELDDRSGATAAIAIHGPDAHDIALAAADASLLRVPAAWPGAPGVEIVAEPTATEAVFAAAVAAGASAISDEDYEQLRIEAGVPRQGYDIDDTTIAQEAYLERDAVSFTKGCFVGQELVCRIDTRGHVNKFLRRLRAGSALARGAPVLAGERAVGTVTSAAGGVALAMLRREVEPGAEVLVRDDAGDVAARVEALVPAE